MAGLDRAARLRYIAGELRTIRVDLAQLCGSDRVGEIKLLDDLALAVDMLRQQSQRQRSSPSSVRRWSQP